MVSLRQMLGKCLAVETLKMNRNLDTVLNLGLKAARTQDYQSAISLFHEALSSDPKCFEAILGLSMGYRKAAEPLKSREFAEMAIRLRPLESASYRSLGLAYMAAEQIVEAVECFEHACKIGPRQPQNFMQLGFALQILRRDEEAIDAFSSALKLAPNAWEICFAMAQSQLIRMDIAGASRNIQNVLRHRPESVGARIMQINVLLAENRSDEAQQRIDKILQNESLDAGAYNMLGMLLCGIGRFSQANEAFRRSIEIEPQQGQAYCSLVLNEEIGSETGELVRKMENLVEQRNVGARSLSFLHFGLGAVNEKLKNYEQAMLQFDAANKLMYELRFGSKKFDKQLYASIIDSLIETYSAKYIENCRRGSSESNSPVFIVGMIRSGTTLVEQILSSHRQVAAKGEQPFWQDYLKAKHQIKGNPLVDSEIRSIENRYLRTIGSIGPEFTHFTDKMPSNYLILGLIHAVFPKATILYCKRNAIDTCLSIYTTPNSAPNDYAYNMENICFAYQEQLRIFLHWRSVIPADRLREISYEELVTSREKVTREMLSACGLTWDESCMNPEQNGHVVWTPSAWQVRQKVYTHSIDKGRHYAPWSRPLQMLDEAIS